MMPGLVAHGAASSIAFTASFANTERRRMLERHLQRVNPRLHGAALRVAVGQAFDSYARYYMESFRLPTLPARTVDRGFRLVGFDHVIDVAGAGQRARSSPCRTSVAGSGPGGGWSTRATR